MKTKTTNRQQKISRVAQKVALDYRKEKKFLKENPNWDYKLFEVLLDMHGENLKPEELDAAGKLANEYLESGKSNSELLQQWAQERLHESDQAG